MLRLFPLLFALLVAACATPEVIDCDLHKVAEMPLQVSDRLLVVPAGINGQWVRLVVDTGAERTVLAESVATRLGLPNDPHHKTQYTGIGGSGTAPDVTIDRLVLGGVHFPLDRIAVGSFTLRTEGGLDADGLLGADILLAFDLDIDVPGDKLTLYRVQRCPRPTLPWPERGIEITGIRAQRDRLLMPFELDGQDGMAILDTGAQRNVLGPDMARRLGLDSASMAADPTNQAHGVGPESVTAHLHRFNLLRIGPVAQQPAFLSVLDSGGGMGDALIGEEFLAGRRVWLSFRNRQVFVAGLVRR